MPYLRAVNTAAVRTNELALKLIIPAVIKPQTFTSLNLDLYPLPLFRAYYRRMTVLYIVLRNLAFILFRLFLKKINREAFLQKCIPLVFLVGKYM